MVEDGFSIHKAHCERVYASTSSANTRRRMGDLERGASQAVHRRRLTAQTDCQCHGREAPVRNHVSVPPFILHVQHGQKLRASREVQLKNRFKKWDVKKYIPDDDLKIMLSLKRKRQSAGKDARFQYKGHDVEQERMERAWKRQRGPLPSPECRFQSLALIAGLNTVFSCPIIYHNVHFATAQSSRRST